MKTRRNFFADAVAASGLVLGACGRAAPPKPGVEEAPPPEGPADVTLRIGPVLADCGNPAAPVDGWQAPRRLR